MMLFFGTTIAGLALDLGTKSLAVTHLKGAEEEYRLIPDWLHFTYTENRGAVFGIGQGQQAIFVLVSIGAIAFLTYLFLMSQKRWFYQLMLGMLLSGVLGNMYDRIFYGYVRDMIFALPGFNWPDFIARLLPATMTTRGVFPWIFNVADMFLCVGVFLMIVYSFVHRPTESPDPQLRGQAKQAR
jgi:signal peptidase II